MMQRHHISTGETDFPQRGAIFGGLLSGLTGAVGGVGVSVLLGAVPVPVDATMIAFTFAGAAIGSFLGWQMFLRLLRHPHHPAWTGSRE